MHCYYKKQHIHCILTIKSGLIEDIYKTLIVAGPAPMQDIAKQIVNCKGPSGPNKEYVYNLAKAMRELASEAKDDHLFILENEVRKMDPDVELN